MSKMQLVEQHIIKPKNKNYNAIKKISHKSKNLYNYANYILRQEFISKKSQTKEYDLTSALSAQNQVDYRALPAQTSQQTIKLLYKNWKSFFAALKAYKKDKTKFNNSPRIPKYKKKKD